MCDFAAILNAFRDQSGTVRDEMNAHGTPNEDRARRRSRTSPASPGRVLEGARVSNAAAHTCAAATGFFCHAHAGRYPEYLYSYRYL